MKNIILFVFMCLSVTIAASVVLMLSQLFLSITSMYETAKPPHFLQMHMGTIEQTDIDEFNESFEGITYWQSVPMITVYGDCISVAEDDKSLRRLIETFLIKNGYTVHCACDGKEALDVLDKEHIDLIVSDIMMPNMSGIEALAAIKQIDPNSKVVMCSAMGQESMVMEAIKLGALDFIVKPFKQDRIVQTVTKILPL